MISRRARAGQDNAMVMKETKSTEEPSAGVEPVHIRLADDLYSRYGHI